MLTERLELAVKRLQESDRFQGVDMAHEEDRKIADKIRVGLGQQLGSFVVVRFGTAASDSPDTPGPYLDSIELQAVCYESPLINRGKNRLTALQLAEAAARQLHWPNDPNNQNLQALQTTFKRFSTGEMGAVIFWTAHFETSLQFNPSQD